MKKLGFSFWSFILIACLVSACSQTKQLAADYRYFDKNLDSLEYYTGSLEEPIIREGDLLSIGVASATLNQEQVAIFNVSSEASKGYMVDAQGLIHMPVLGSLQVGGLKKTALEKLLLQNLAPYVKNPVINIRFLNFKVLMLGETRQGFITFDNEKSTVLDAIGMAGGISETGLRTNILLIRQLPGGKKLHTRLNINDANIFASPYFQLQQNDIIYVMPTDSKLAVYKRTNNPFFRDFPVYLGLFTSAIALLTLGISLTR